MLRTRASGELDAAAAARIHPNDRRRVVRALELAEGGRSLVPLADALFGGAWRHPTLLVGLDVPKPELERRIAERTRRMFDAGVEDEVRNALLAELSVTALKIIGLQEVATLPREEAIERTDRPHAALRRLSAQVAAAPGRARYRRGRPAAGGDRS